MNDPTPTKKPKPGRAATAETPVAGKRTATEQRQVQRREEKQGGRTRRAELLMNKQVEEKARQDALEDRVKSLEDRVAALEDYLADAADNA